MVIELEVFCLFVAFAFAFAFRLLRFRFYEIVMFDARKGAVDSQGEGLKVVDL